MAITNSRSNKFLSSLGVAAVLLLTQLLFTTNTALAKEKVTIAIISFSPYAPWYIVKEKDLAKNIEIDVQIIDDQLVFQLNILPYPRCPMVLTRWL